MILAFEKKKSKPLQLALDLGRKYEPIRQGDNCRLRGSTCDQIGGGDGSRTQKITLLRDFSIDLLAYHRPYGASGYHLRTAGITPDHKKWVTKVGYSRPSTRPSTFSRAWAVWAASPCTRCAYTPYVSIWRECPTRDFTAPSGRVFARETKVCRKL